jgi:hypothetical protein
MDEMSSLMMNGKGKEVENDGNVFQCAISGLTEENQEQF